MTSFDQRFIENPDFLKWVFNPDLPGKLYWEQYLLEHPEEKEGILELKDHLLKLSFPNEKLSFGEKENLANRIQKSIREESGKSAGRSLITHHLSPITKYAAVFLAIMSLGCLLFFLKTNKRSLNQNQIAQTFQIPTESQGPLLITSNGNNVNLKKQSSTINYSANGTIVLNNDSVIQDANEEADALNQLIIPYGNQSRVVLSDNTVVWLNAGSRLSYPAVFKNKTREVMLVGEAFFEVAKNPEKPFIVKTSDLQIRVLGTKFNVSAYQEDNVIQTVLKEGSVSIRRNGGNIFEKEIIIKPNQMASFDKKNRDTKIYEVDADYYKLWTQGLISFDEIDLDKIIKKLERYYNISVNFSDSKIGTMHLSGKLDLKHGRKDAIEYLEKVTGSKFEQIKENQYMVKQ